MNTCIHCGSPHKQIGSWCGACITTSVGASSTDPNPPVGAASTDSYRIERHKHGMAAFGSLPCSTLPGLLSVWSERFGHTHIDTEIAKALGATLVVCSPDAGDDWRLDLGLATKPAKEAV